MDRTQQKIIKSQLSLRAVIWDIPKEEGMDTGRLDREMELFQIKWIRTWELEGAIQESRMKDAARGSMRYEKASEILWKLGISEKEALFVTEDARMAEYVYGLRHVKEDAAGVVYYEKEGSRTDVSADMTVLGFEEIGIQFLDRIQKRRNHLPWNILYTERTYVREITMSDLDELYLLYEGEGITDYMEPLYERREEEEYTRRYIDYMYYYYGYGMWVIRDKKTGALLGRAGIDHRELEGEVVMELGYMIGREYQNQGYATEVCQAIIEYAQQELEIEELHCFIHPDNKASRHLAEKLGFEIHAAKHSYFLHFIHRINQDKGSTLLNK